MSTQLSKSYVFVSFNSVKTLNNILTCAFTAVINWQDKHIHENQEKIFTQACFLKDRELCVLYVHVHLIIILVVKIPIQLFYIQRCIVSFATVKGWFANGFNSKE